MSPSDLALTRGKVWLWAPILFLSVSMAEAGAPQCSTTATPRVLIAGDSWAQFMWDDGSHSEIFDKFGHGDKTALSRSLDSEPGPGYTGPEYAISGSEARQWVDTANYPWIANTLADLAANPSVETVMLSIGGNDVLAGRPDGGWYKDMDLDVPGSEAAFFESLRKDTLEITQALLDADPSLQVLVSSYEYPNFNVSPLTCEFFACPKRRDLSRDPVNDLITDLEINNMMVLLEGLRIGWVQGGTGMLYDNSVGLMHHVYGDGVSAPGVLPRPGLQPPNYTPFPGGNPLLPTLRENFRPFLFLDADPIHLDEAGYRDKIHQQMESTFLPKFRGQPAASFRSQGADRDGWTDGSVVDTSTLRLGDDAAAASVSVLSFDTSALPEGVPIAGASLYLQRRGAEGSNPFLSGNLGTPALDIATGSFGNPELETGDSTAVADAENVGCFVGTVQEDDYALRVDLSPDGLQAINRQGLTQLRIAFPNVDPGADAVLFHTGDGQLLRGEQRLEDRLVTVYETDSEGHLYPRSQVLRAMRHQGLGEALGSPAPLLDVYFDLAAITVFADDFESGAFTAWGSASPTP